MTTITHERPTSAPAQETRDAPAQQTSKAAAQQKRDAPAQQTSRAAAQQTRDAAAQQKRDDALAPVSGILDIADGRAFVRTSGYRMGRDDVYVSADQVRQYGLRRGDHIAGAARPAGQGEIGRA